MALNETLNEWQDAIVAINKQKNDSIEAEVRVEAQDEFDQCSTMLNDAEREIEALQAKVADMTAYNETRTDELAASVTQCMELQAKVAELECFIEQAFNAHPNLDLDVTALENRENA